MPLAQLPEAGFAGATLETQMIQPVTQPGSRGPDKPGGGVWLSPLRRDGAGRPAGTAWTDWCAEEGYELPPGCAQVRAVRLAGDARIAVISTLSDYDQLAAACGQLDIEDTPYTGLRHLDWASVASAADGVWLTAEGLDAVAGPQGPLYGWDTETILILNPAVLIPEAGTPGVPQ